MAKAKQTAQETPAEPASQETPIVKQYLDLRTGDNIEIVSDPKTGKFTETRTEGDGRKTVTVHDKWSHAFGRLQEIVKE